MSAHDEPGWRKDDPELDALIPEAPPIEHFSDDDDLVALTKAAIAVNGDLVQLYAEAARRLLHGGAVDLASMDIAVLRLHHPTYLAAIRAEAMAR